MLSMSINSTLSNSYRKRRKHDERDVISGRYPKRLALDMSHLTLQEELLQRELKDRSEPAVDMEGIEQPKKHVIYIENLDRELEEISREEQEKKLDGTIELLAIDMKRPHQGHSHLPSSNAVILWQPNPYQDLKATETPDSKDKEKDMMEML